MLSPSLSLSLSLAALCGSETAARVAAEAKAEEGLKVLKDKEAAVGRVDRLTRQAVAQADSYDALVRASGREDTRDRQTESISVFDVFWRLMSFVSYKVDRRQRENADVEMPAQTLARTRAHAREHANTRTTHDGRKKR